MNDNNYNKIIETIKYENIEHGNYRSPQASFFSNSSLDSPRIKSSFLSTPKSFSWDNQEDDEQTKQEYLTRKLTAPIIPDFLDKKSLKPESVLQLEQVLQKAYGDTNIRITSIKDMPTTRKQLKRIYFLKDFRISQVWVFKADPKETIKELNAYYIAYKHGVPTGKPIAYEPQKNGTYGFDIAILGGAIVGHAGNPYDQLVRMMDQTPDLIFETAKSISKIIADYHIKLTLAKNEFEEYDVQIPQASPRKELNNRLFAALKIDESKASNLIKSCENLYSKLNNESVVSHGDIHTQNIVTNEVDHAPSIKDFGIIDWGEIMLDNGFGDLQDFWLHHLRLAKKANNNYKFSFDELKQIYINVFNQKGRNHNFQFVDSQKDELIQSTLWNIYELYDPVRTNKNEIEEKATFHFKILQDSLEKLKYLSCRNQTNSIQRELRTILKDKEYLSL
ncbi:MAG: hypothetical protein ABIC91_05860 [Nanoarchaeota archaeon]|nr:hypothetical protein [Nanoarchaeota archaeon]MBU1030974.1 hypothetical protein [Nanoarchaeota archaeon]MBU1850161.1 hypothetical protein [Nanoarchaeota archaeon]